MDKIYDDYRQYSNGQLLQIGKIVSPFGVIVLLYFIFSDIYLREMPTWAFTRILPLLFLLIFSIASCTKLVKKRPSVLITIYNIAWFSLVSMSYSIAIIAWNSESLQIAVTAISVVCLFLFLAMRGNTINIVLICLIPSFLFVIYILGFMDEPNKLANFANSFVIILGVTALYHYNEKLRRNKYFTENQLFIANQKMSLLTTELQDQNVELQNALKEVSQLSGLLPICAQCKKIRDDKGYWNQIESYIHEHSEAEFSHSICPDCARKLYPDFDLYED